MSGQYLELLKQRRNELASLTPTQAGWPAFIQWHTRTRLVVDKLFPDQVGQFDEIKQVSWIGFPRVISRGRPYDTTVDDAERRANDGLVKNAKERFAAHIEAMIELAEIDSIPRSDSSKSPTSQIALNVSPDIFVVHGHDEEMKEAVARVLAKLGLNPIILHEQANGGKTVIEKFEANADVGYAVVLLSQDDIGYAVKDKSKTEEPRARQNVLLELGYFVGRLGRAKVCALRRGEPVIPSDLSGVVYTPYDSSWPLKLCKELRAAGYQVTADDL